MIYSVFKSEYIGFIKVPSSKSDSQRAILIAALSEEKSTIYNLGKSKDEIAMLEAVKILGAKINFIDENTIEVTGIHNLLKDKTISTGESGLGIRLLTAVSSIFPYEITLIGEGSLQQRPMSFFDQVLPKLGVSIQTANGFLPIKVKGPLHGGKIEINGNQSSQFLSGLLIALSQAKEDSIIKVFNLKSIPYIEMTINSLQRFGVTIQHQNFKNFKILGNQKIHGIHYEIEGDWSSASYWLVAAALGLAVSVKNLSENSLQADKAILEAFKLANCQYQFTSDGLKVMGNNRTTFQFDATHCPDLFPALAVLAALTVGESQIIGVNRLIHKESNRALSIQAEFKKLGISCLIEDDVMKIIGKESIEGGQDLSAHNDHRIAMSLAILGLKCEQNICIHGAECVAKSYPDFWDHLDSIRCK
jgi:3-phosphoshikimate 1-carboxyvinyltransferase